LIQALNIKRVWLEGFKLFAKRINDNNEDNKVTTKS